MVAVCPAIVFVCQLPLLLFLPLVARAVGGCAEKVSAEVEVDTGHPWRPPFGLERVGAPITIRVALDGPDAAFGEYVVVGYRDGKETERQALHVTGGKSPFFSSATFASPPDVVSLLAMCGSASRAREIRRQTVRWPVVEAQAKAHPSHQINPIDLGTVLVPYDWLLLAKGQESRLEVAAISRLGTYANARVRAWFDGSRQVNVSLPLLLNQRASTVVTLPFPAIGEHGLLNVVLEERGNELWRTTIRTMIVKKKPRWPKFGAVETKLRYDASISVKDQYTGQYSSFEYERGWDPRLKDVLVFLPNGSRFVFWRGSSYIPFWAGLYNTGLTYQWAETVPPPGYVDCVEPLQDKELRFGRANIVESTVSRVHVRWTYESVDVNYRSLGDQAYEDFYFYPDGFGTRVLTLTSSPAADYEITEFITLLPQSAYPFELMPNRLIEMMFLDGKKIAVDFPFQPTGNYRDRGILTQRPDPNRTPRVYRIFSEKRDSAAAIYFSPHDVPVVQQVFKPFYDHGEIVTPGYWGNHWPLGRGAPTGGAIDERIHLSPAHISTFPWGLWSAGNRPIPLFSGTSTTIDAQGHSRPMLTQRWSWLIAKTDAPDDELLQWANSYSTAPSLKINGARFDFPSYSTERRAIRLVAEGLSIDIELTPAVHTMNPIFEIANAPAALVSVSLNAQPLPHDAWAWDGKTLWTRASIDTQGARLRLEFK